MTVKTFAGKCIYHSTTGINVYENFIYRWLTLNSDVLQTIISRRHPEKPILKYIKQLTLAVRKQPADCCLLGLGGAGVAHALAPYIGKSHIVAVESSIEVIDTAKAYFMTDNLKNLTVVHQDANIFIQQCQSYYKHLLVDLFDAYSFPAHCNNYDFFDRCQHLLLTEGVLAVNLANLHEQWPVFEHIRNSFNGNTVALPVKGTANMVILACKGDSIAPLLNLVKQSQHLKKLSWDVKWGCVALI